MSATRKRSDLAILTLLVASLALGARYLQDKLPAPLAAESSPSTSHSPSREMEREHPRVEVDGVAIGDRVEKMKVEWGRCEVRELGNEMFVHPQQQPPTSGIDILERRRARTDLRGRATEVNGHRLTIEGGESFSVGDSTEKIRKALGKRDESLYLRRGGCGYPGPMTRWNYKRHGIILSFVVPNKDWYRKKIERSAPAGYKRLAVQKAMADPFLNQVYGVSVHLDPGD